MPTQAGAPVDTALFDGGTGLAITLREARAGLARPVLIDCGTMLIGGSGVESSAKAWQGFFSGKRVPPNRPIIRVSLIGMGG
jgi:hypothetical protein